MELNLLLAKYGKNYTDHKQLVDGIFIEDLIIECDGEMFYNNRFSTRCVERNKWGECKDYKPYVYG